jgi:hypothetical protein
LHIIRPTLANLVGYLGVQPHTIDLTKFIKLLHCQVDENKQVNSGVMAERER